MKRRGFLQALFGAPAIPLVAVLPVVEAKPPRPRYVVTEDGAAVVPYNMEMMPSKELAMDRLQALMRMVGRD